MSNITNTNKPGQWVESYANHFVGQADWGQAPRPSDGQLVAAAVDSIAQSIPEGSITAQVAIQLAVHERIELLSPLVGLAESGEGMSDTLRLATALEGQEEISPEDITLVGLRLAYGHGLRSIAQRLYPPRRVESGKNLVQKSIVQTAAKIARRPPVPGIVTYGPFRPLIALGARYLERRRQLVEDISHPIGVYPKDIMITDEGKFALRPEGRQFGVVYFALQGESGFGQALSRMTGTPASQHTAMVRRAGYIIDFCAAYEAREPEIEQLIVDAAVRGVLPASLATNPNLALLTARYYTD